MGKSTKIQIQKIYCCKYFDCIMSECSQFNILSIRLEMDTTERGQAKASSLFTKPMFSFLKKVFVIVKYPLPRAIFIEVRVLGEVSLTPPSAPPPLKG